MGWSSCPPFTHRQRTVSPAAYASRSVCGHDLPLIARSKMLFCCSLGLVVSGYTSIIVMTNTRSDVSGGTPAGSMINAPVSCASRPVRSTNCLSRRGRPIEVRARSTGGELDDPLLAGWDNHGVAPAGSPCRTSVESPVELITVTRTVVPCAARMSGPGMRGAPSCSAKACTVSVVSTSASGSHRAGRASRTTVRTPFVVEPAAERLSFATASAAMDCCSCRALARESRRASDNRARASRSASPGTRVRRRVEASMPKVWLPQSFPALMPAAI